MNSLVQRIKNTLCENPPMQHKNGGYIKTGFNPELDKLRQISENAVQWMVDYQAQEKQKTKINKRYKIIKMMFVVH